MASASVGVAAGYCGVIGRGVLGVELSESLVRCRFRAGEPSAFRKGVEAWDEGEEVDAAARCMNWSRMVSWGTYET